MKSVALEKLLKRADQFGLARFLGIRILQPTLCRQSLRRFRLIGSVGTCRRKVTKAVTSNSVLYRLLQSLLYVHHTIVETDFSYHLYVLSPPFCMSPFHPAILNPTTNIVVTTTSIMAEIRPNTKLSGL